MLRGALAKAVISSSTNNRTESGAACPGKGGRPACRAARPAQHSGKSPGDPDANHVREYSAGREIPQAGRPPYPMHATRLLHASGLFRKMASCALGRVHEIFDLPEIGGLIQGWDEIHRSEKTDQRSSLANVGVGRLGGPAFRGGSAPGSDGARIGRGRPLFAWHGLSVAGFAGGAGRLAGGLHALPALGGARRLAASVEKSPNSIFCPGTGAVRGFDDGAHAAPCGGRAVRSATASNTFSTSSNSSAAGPLAPTSCKTPSPPHSISSPPFSSPRIREHSLARLLASAATKCAPSRHPLA